MPPSPKVEALRDAEFVLPAWAISDPPLFPETTAKILRTARFFNPLDRKTRGPAQRPDLETFRVSNLTLMMTTTRACHPERSEGSSRFLFGGERRLPAFSSVASTVFAHTNFCESISGVQPFCHMLHLKYMSFDGKERPPCRNTCTCWWRGSPAPITIS